MIYISKSSVEFRYIEVDEEGGEKAMCVDVMKSNLGIISYLTFPVEIEEGVTVKNILDIFAANTEVTDFVFDSSLGGYSFEDFYVETKESLVSSPNIDHMEICHDNDEVVDGDGFFFSVPRLRGLGKEGELYSVEFSPISTYMNIPLKLNKSYKVKIVDESGEEKNSLNLHKDFTLYEVLHAVLYELSYHGNPVMRQQALTELLEEYGHTLSKSDDMEKLKTDLKRLLDVEDYEAAARIRDRIRQMKREDGTIRPDDDIN